MPRVSTVRTGTCVFLALVSLDWPRWQSSTTSFKSSLPRALTSLGQDQPLPRRDSDLTLPEKTDHSQSRLKGLTRLAVPKSNFSFLSALV